MKSVLFIFLLLFTGIAQANESTIALEKAHVNLRDVDSLKRGAKFFSTVCMACHTLVYLRYDKFAQQQGILYAKMPVNSKALYFGAKPPDLSLITRVRGSDWVYTYLQSFYQDLSRPSGFNNLVLPNSAMPNMLISYQGLQVRVDENISEMMYSKHHQWYDLLQLTKPGTMTPAQFDATMQDVVNFLAYAAEPHQVEQRTIGYWVIGFLLIFFIFAYRLKQEYWKDVEKPTDSNHE